MKRQAIDKKTSSSCALAASLLAGFVLLLAAASPPQEAHAQEDAEAASPQPPADPQASRLFLSSTARPLGAGGVYASVAQVFTAEVGVGLGGAFDVRAGAFLLPPEGFGERLTAASKVTLLQTQTDALFENTPLSVALETQLTARRRTYVPDVDLRGGPLIYVGVRSNQKWDLAAVPRVLATYGSPEAALTAGFGVTLGDPIGDDSPLASSMVATLGGEVQVWDWLKLLSENHLYLGAERKDLFFELGRWEDSSILSNAGRAEPTLAEFVGGARLTWASFAFEGALTATTADQARGNGWDYSLLPFLRLSYRF